MTRGVGGKSYTTRAIQICGSCLMWEANGCDDNDPTDGASYAAGVERETMGHAGHLSIGWTREADRENARGDRLMFCHWPCDLCGDKRAGDRYKATLWLPVMWERDERGRYVRAWTVGSSTFVHDAPPHAYHWHVRDMTEDEDRAACRADQAYDARKDARDER